MAKKVAFYGMLLSLAFIAGYIEWLLPLPIAVPGVKLGLANSIVLFVLDREGIKNAALFSVIRVILSGFLFGSMAGILYAFFGAAASLFVMGIMKRSGKFSMIGISASGGAAHNTGQIAAAFLVMKTGALFYYLPFLWLSGILTGIVVGILAAEVMKRI